MFLVPACTTNSGPRTFRVEDPGRLEQKLKLSFQQA